MHIDIITLFPELLKSPFETSILKKAISSNKVNIFFHNLRNFKIYIYSLEGQNLDNKLNYIQFYFCL